MCQLCDLAKRMTESLYKKPHLKPQTLQETNNKNDSVYHYNCLKRA